MLKKFIIAGCLIGASFFIGCQNTSTKNSEDSGSSAEKNIEEKELEMYEVSELASLMRQMYEDNLDLKQRILNGELPDDFPEEFKKIHTADATDPSEINETFKALATQYIQNMQDIADAETTAEAKLAYNSMVGTCASCHQIYCQGPLAKIRKMRISDTEQ